jgi:hypothetical protein
MNSGASAANEPAIDGEGEATVSRPPNALCPLTMGCAPPRRPRPKPARLLFLPRVASGAGIGASDTAGVDPFIKGWFEVAFASAPGALPPRRPLLRGALFAAARAGGGVSTLDMAWN